MNPIQAVEAGAQAALEAVRALLSAQPPVAAQDGSPMTMGATAPAVEGPPAAAIASPAATPLSEPPRVSGPADGRATLTQLAAGHAPHVAAMRTAAVAAVAAAALPAQVSALANAAAARGLVGAAGTPADAAQRSTALPPENPALMSLARPTDSVAVPVMITPLQTLAAHLQRPAHLPTDRRPPSPPPRPREAARGAGTADGESARTGEPGDHTAGTLPSLAADEERGRRADLHGTEPEPSYARLERWLAEAEQHVALRELAQRRRVLLIVPANDVGRHARAARVHLLVPHPHPHRRGEAHTFNARWWPGAGHRADWTAWRLLRDADAAGGPRLQSRHLSPVPAGAVTLLLRLGPTPASLLDAGSACLDVPDVQRFGHHLGGQWSLLALCCHALPHGADSPSA